MLDRFGVNWLAKGFVGRCWNVLDQCWTGLALICWAGHVLDRIWQIWTSLGPVWPVLSQVNPVPCIQTAHRQIQF